MTIKAEWLSSLLKESIEILETDRIQVSRESTAGDSMEQQCVLLLSAFEKSSDPRFFQGLYSLTEPLFAWFAESLVKKEGLPVKPEELTRRLYAVLCELIHFPGFAFSADNLLEWCLTLLENLAEQEKEPLESRDKISHLSPAQICPSLTEAYQRSSRKEEPDRIQERMTLAWFGVGANLGDLEREALNLYYKKGLSLKEFAENMNLSLERAESLLSVSRWKLLQALHRKEVGRITLDEEEPS